MDDMIHSESPVDARHVRVRGSTRVVGLLGWPVSHSRSPAMHNAAFAALGLDFVYVPLPVAPERIDEAVRGLAALGFAGANVTVPHKAAVLPFLAGASPTVQSLGAANTLVVQPDGSLWGDNTDGPGLIADLMGHGINPAGMRVLLLGAGGAARGVAHALAEAGSAIAVANRTVARAEDLCQSVRAALPEAEITAHPFPEALPELARAADLIVNATSLGLHPDRDPIPWDPAVPFRPDQVVYDLIYAPQGGRGEPAPLLQLAQAAGARAFDGLGMLVQQGARSFELWTGQPAPVDIMMEAAREHP